MALNKCLERAGLRRIRVHDLRHSYASIRLNRGHNVGDVSKQLGHLINMAEKKPITKDMLIADIVSKHPETASIMLESGLHCINCVLAASESLEDGALAHGLTEKQVDDMVKKMNDVATKSGGKAHGKGKR